MVDKTITALSELAEVDMVDIDMLPIAQVSGPVTKKVKAGAFRAVRFFNPAKSYNMSDVVSYNDKLYKALVTTTTGGFNAVEWLEIGAAIDEGRY